MVTNRVKEEARESRKRVDLDLYLFIREKIKVRIEENKFI